MTKQEWERCYEPAPPAFAASVQRALRMKKEERPMKRAIPRTAILIFALLLALMGTALAVGGGILDFLHTDDLGAVEIQQPQMTALYEGLEILSDIQVREAVCDGYSVHILTTYTIDPAKGALIFGNDWNKTDLPFAAERADAPTVYILNPGELSIETGGKVYSAWDSWAWRYDSAFAITLDTSFFVSDMALGDELTVTRTDTLEQQRAADSMYWDTQAEMPYSVTIPVQTVGTRVYAAANLPLRLENYRVNAARVIRTDLACYIEVEVEDDYDLAEYAASFVEVEEPYRYEWEDGTIEEGVEVYERSTLTLPLHGSWWFGVQTPEGGEYPAMTNNSKTLTDNDEWVHFLRIVMVPRFDVGERLVLLPRDTGTGEAYGAIELALTAQ